MLANKCYTILFKNNILTFQIAKDGNDIITKKIKKKTKKRGVGGISTSGVTSWRQTQKGLKFSESGSWLLGSNLEYVSPVP